MEGRTRQAGEKRKAKAKGSSRKHKKVETETLQTIKALEADLEPDKDGENGDDDDDDDNEPDPDLDVYSGLEDQNSSSELDTEDEIEVSKRSKPATSRKDDPAAFANSIQKILASSLKSSVKASPILVRAPHTSQPQSVVKARLESKAKRQLAVERRQREETGRVRDVLTGWRAPSSGNVAQEGDVGEAIEHEKRLRKIAQKGVVKLFNAIRAAQGGDLGSPAPSSLDGSIGQPRSTTSDRNATKKPDQMQFLQMLKKPVSNKSSPLARDVV